MDITERSRDRVREVIDRLDAERGVDRVVEGRWTFSPDDYDHLVHRFEEGTVGGAGAWVVDGEGRVLLVQRAGYDAWQEPSGKHEPGEALVETARREVREEAGVEVEPRGVALAQEIEVVDTEGERPPIVRLVVVFHADYVGGDLDPRPGEIADARWFAERPDDLLYEHLEDLPFPAAMG